MHVTVSELKSTLQDAFVLDVREPQEYDDGHVPGATLMPLATVPVRHSELPKDRAIYVICRTGGRSFTGATWLAQQGYDVRNVTGGIVEWQAQGFPVSLGRDA